MSAAPNILFIMADQLRADYLGCAGHPVLKTPNIDALAADGVMFSRAFCQGPVCGSSRASFYTGRYMASHGSTYNNVPLAAGEWTLGDHLAPLGYRTVLVGKTHMVADREGMARLGVDPASPAGVLIGEAGFEPFERDDGLHPDISLNPALRYNRWLNELGYKSENPWHEIANAAEGADGEVLSGWYLRNANLPARVREEHSETAYMTDRAMAFIEEAGEDSPWCLHLSYIKPHWPYMAPDPYHALYAAEDILPANRVEAEREHAHPVVSAFREHDEGVNFSREGVRRTVIPTYMGLIAQLDAHLGRLFDFLKTRGLWDNTVIVFTSDHGDYLGDHWLGEKELFHEESLRLPLIIRNPAPGADATRGRTEDALAEAIDLIPTFVEMAGGEVTGQVLEGRSLQPLLSGDASNGATPAGWREAVFSEADYAFRPARLTLGVAADRARATMVRTEDWKMVEYEGFGCELYDLRNDPLEQVDLGGDTGHEAVRAELGGRIADWRRHLRNRTTMDDAEVARRTGTARKRGYIFGIW